jgi:hypothetical protein
MGMYPTEKEIPSVALHKLLERPWDDDFVDGLLFRFDEEGVWRWSPEASRSSLSDQELLRRFVFPYLSFTLDEMRSLGELDGGKYSIDEEMEEPPFFQYLLMTGEPDREEDLWFLLSTMNEIGGHLKEMKAKLEERFHPPSPVFHDRWTWRGADSEKCYGFASSVPCYGINGYTPANEVAETWASLRRVLEYHAELRPLVVQLFQEPLRFYYGCATRGSAVLDVMW